MDFDFTNQMEYFKKRIEKNGERLLALQMLVETDGHIKVFGGGFKEMHDELAIAVLANHLGLRVTSK